MASEESERSAGDSHHFALPNGTKLFEFEIDNVLGHGGFGITYLATDMHLQEQVAIKEYLPNELAVRLSSKEVSPKSGGSRADFEAGLKAFLEEARLVARVKHSNIVRVRRFFEFQGTGYIVQEYEEGTTLSQRLGKGSLPEQELRTILLKVLDGLEYAHERAILHRDVKPSNIMLRKDGTPVLIDFGAARDFASRHSRSITAIASPGYTPPEQFGIGGEQGPWTDIYALGAVLYRCVTGKPPIDSLRRLRKDALVPASVEASGNYDPVLLKLIDWMLQIEESDRPASVNAVREALQGIDAGAVGDLVLLSKAKPAGRGIGGETAEAVKSRHEPRRSDEKNSESKSFSPFLRNIGIGVGVALVLLLGSFYLFRQGEQSPVVAQNNWSAKEQPKPTSIIDQLPDELSAEDRSKALALEKRLLEIKFPRRDGENWSGESVRGNVRIIHFSSAPENCRTVRHEVSFSTGTKSFAQGQLCKDADGRWVAEVR